MNTIFQSSQKNILLTLIFIVFKANVSLFAQCMNDVACYMDSWRNESNAVVHFIIPSLTGGLPAGCTGTLINNEARNGRPYLLTACHCIDIDGQNGISQAERDNVANYSFRFKFRSITCNGQPTETEWTTTGAVFRMAYLSSDVALIELNQQPPF